MSLAIRNDPTRSAERPIRFRGGRFAVVHSPAVQPGRAGWVLCGPFGSERTNSHRLFVVWSRVLASAGYWVLRFDYRGTGDSFGRFQDYSIHDYVDDISLAVDELEFQSGLRCRGLIGLRLGADLAAIAASKDRRCLELVLWEPVLDGAKIRKALPRTTVANEMVNRGRAHRTQSELLQEIAVGGEILADGFPLTRTNLDPLSEIDSGASGRPTSGRILIAQVDSRPNRAPRPALARLVESYRTDGEASLVVVHETRVWLKTNHYRWRLDGLFDPTLEWMRAGDDDRLYLTRRSSSEGDSLHDPLPIERPVTFEVEGSRVWGILHEPSTPRVGAPSIVMVSAGEACRTAFFYPDLARELASMGWRVLRFDPRGIGDSEGEIRGEYLADVFHQIEIGGLVPDVVAALDFLEQEIGPEPSVLVGLCGGAITSLLTTQIDDRVAGLAALEFALDITQPTEAGHGSPRTPEIPWHESLSQHRSTLFLLSLRNFYRSARRRWKSTANRLGGRAKEFEAPAGPTTHRNLDHLGPDANLPVISAIDRCLEHEIPVCFVFAENDRLRAFREVFRPDALDGAIHGENTVLKTIKGADHNFIMPGCGEQLAHHLILWLHASGLDGESSKRSEARNAPDRTANDHIGSPSRSNIGVE